MSSLVALIVFSLFRSSSFGLHETVIRLRFEYIKKRKALRETFADLFGKFGTKSYFELSIVFNLVLHNEKNKEYSVFYGLDYTHSRLYGAQPNEKIQYGDIFSINSLDDVLDVPIEFNNDYLLQHYNTIFIDSGVVVHEIVNIVYLVRKLFDQ